MPDYFSAAAEDESDKEECRCAQAADGGRRVPALRHRMAVPHRPARRVPRRGLPSNVTKELGPARLTHEYAVDTNGAVNATYRFDTVKGRYSPKEADALRTALKELNEAPVLLVNFELAAFAALTAGDFRGALQGFQSLATLHPKEALHRVQFASGLLRAGLAERARTEAAAATKLEPSSAVAWQTLGWVLQHDLVGRRFGKGFDYAGSVAAYRKAKALDPKDTVIAGDLAILLEHDADGERYSTDSHLSEAITEYRARKKLLAADDTDSLEDNLAFALFYAGRFEESRDWAMKAARTQSRNELELASIAPSPERTRPSRIRTGSQRTRPRAHARSRVRRTSSCACVAMHRQRTCWPHRKARAAPQPCSSKSTTCAKLVVARTCRLRRAVRRS